MIILADIKSIFDRRVSSFLNNRSRESTAKAKHCLESLRTSEQISNALTGFELQFVEILRELIPKSEYEIFLRVETSIF